jgi:hypothetical protein
MTCAGKTLVVAAPHIGRGYNAAVLALFDGGGVTPASVKSQG